MRTRLGLLGLVATLAIAGVARSGLSEAATFTVTSAADTVDANPGDGVCADAGGQCTLRAAIMQGNALGGAHTIVLAAATYALTIPGDLSIASDLTLNGAGAAATMIVRQGSFDRVLRILSGTVTISSLTLTGGNRLFGGGGGGISNGGTLTLTGSVVSGNSASGGGNNDDGAGILNEPGATAALIDSTVSGNTLTGFRFGGGLANLGTLTLTRSTVSGNTTTGSGGGIANGGTLVVTNSTVSGNAASCGGGGIENFGGTAALTGSTLSDNSASGGPCGGGGLRVFLGSATVGNTIVASNPSGGDCAGALTSLGHNLGGDGTCAFIDPTDLPSVNPQLGPLASNGGPTATHALLAGSPAIDAVPLGACVVSTDQRGLPRPQGPACDIGAYEAVTAACVAPPAGMVAWWPFDEGAGATSFQDVAGGNHATPLLSPVGGVQAPQPAFGVVGGAIDFPKFGNGLSGARVSAQGALATVGAANFTIDAWINVPPGPANRRHYIVNKFDAGGNRGYALYVVSPGVAGNERLEFTWGDGTTVSAVQTIAPMTTGQWHHVAMTFTRSASTPTLDIRLYVDGVQAGQQTGDPPGLGSLVNFLFLEIGWQPDTLDEPITIDELEIFDVALSPSQVQALHGAGGAGKCKCTSGGQSVDLTVTGTGAVFGVGNGTPAVVGSPLSINYSLQGCFGRELFLIAVVNAPPIVLLPSYHDGSTWVPLPASLSLVTPFLIGGPATANGTHTLFSGTLPPGSYDLYLACDLFVNGHLDVTNPPLCLSGAFDHLPLTVP